MRTPIVVLVGMALLAPGAAWSQGAGESLTAPDVVKRLEEHPRMRQAQLSLEQAQVRARGEEKLLTTLFQSEGNYLRNEEPTRGLIENGVRQTDIFQLNLSLSRRLRWGTDLSLSLDNTRFEAVQPFELPGVGRQTQTIGPNWQQQLSLTLRQPLLRGFGEEVNLTPKRAADAQLEVAQAQRQQAASQVLLEVMGAFFELAYAERDLEIKARQVAFAQDQREATEALVEAGRLPEVELDVIDQRKLLLQETQLVGEHDLRTRRLALERLLGLPPGRGIAQTQTDLALAAPEEPLEALLERARAQNPELLALREQVEASRLRLDASQDATRPQLDLTMILGQNALSEDGIFDATGQLLGLEATRFFAGVLFAMPLDNGRANAQLEADQMDVQRLQLQVQELEGQLEEQVRAAASLVQLGQDRLSLSRRGVELARRTLEAEQARFKAGRSTNQQVLQYQEELERAEVRELRTRVDLLQSILQLRHLTGTLLESWGLRPEAP